MTRFEYTASLEEAMLCFFPELTRSTVKDCIVIGFQENLLMFSITFFKDSFELSTFHSKLNKLNEFIKLDGIIPINDIIQPIINDKEESEEYFYKIPLHLSQGFSK